MWPFSFFPSLKSFVLSGRHYKSRKALASAISQCLNGLSKSAYRDAFHNLIRKIMHLNPRRILKGNAMCIPLSESNAHLRNHKIYTYTYRTTIVCFAWPKGRIENILFAYRFSDVLFEKASGFSSSSSDGQSGRKTPGYLHWSSLYYRGTIKSM